MPTNTKNTNVLMKLAEDKIKRHHKYIGHSVLKIWVTEPTQDVHKLKSNIISIIN